MKEYEQRTQRTCNELRWCKNQEKNKNKQQPALCIMQKVEDCTFQLQVHMSYREAHTKMIHFHFNHFVSFMFEALKKKSTSGGMETTIFYGY